MGGLFGGGGEPDIPQATKKAPRRVEPDLDRARAKRDIRSKQKSLATSRPLDQANIKARTLGA